MPITMLYFKLSSVLMFDVYNNTAPHNILHLFIPTQQIHSYSTRSSSSGNYYFSHFRLNQKNGLFSIMGAKIWNSIPENLRNLSKSLFKEKVLRIDHFTVSCLVAWPLNESEAGGDLGLIEASLLFSC